MSNTSALIKVDPTLPKWILSADVTLVSQFDDPADTHTSGQSPLCAFIREHPNYSSPFCITSEGKAFDKGAWATPLPLATFLYNVKPFSAELCADDYNHLGQVMNIPGHTHFTLGNTFYSLNQPSSSQTSVIPPNNFICNPPWNFTKQTEFSREDSGVQIMQKLFDGLVQAERKSRLEDGLSTQLILTGYLGKLSPL